MERMAREGWDIARAALAAALAAAVALVVGPAAAWSTLALAGLGAAVWLVSSVVLWRRDVRDARAELAQR